MGNGHCCPNYQQKSSTMYSNKEELTDNIHLILQHSPTSHTQSDKKGVQKLTVQFYRPKQPCRQSVQSIRPSESMKFVKAMISGNTQQKKTAQQIILQSKGKQGKEENFCVKADSHFNQKDIGFIDSVLGIIRMLQEKKAKETKVYLKYSKNLKKHMAKILEAFLQMFLSLGSKEGRYFTLSMEIDDLKTYKKVAKKVKDQRMRRSSSIQTEMKISSPHKLY